MEAEPIADYRLRPGDTVQIKFFYHGDLNEKQMIGPDGKITLQLIDQVLAAGLTASQLDEELTKEYAKYLENYDVSVIVRGYSGLKVFVGGEVRSPGFLSLRGNLSVFQAIVAKGGFTNSAKLENIVLIRKGPDNRPVAMVIDLKPVVSGEQIENDIYLMPSDIVYVPKTFIAKAGVFVDQYLRKVLMVDSIIYGAGNALGYYWAREHILGHEEEWVW